MHTKLKNIIVRRPFTFFIGSLVLLLAVIAVGNFMGKKEVSKENEVSEPKVVSIYEASQNPTVTVLAKVQKDGVIQISSTGGGIVQTIFKKEGQKVRKGETIVSLSSTYSGSSAQRVQRQIAERNLKLSEDNYNDQKDLIQKRRELAEKADTQADEIREITQKSLEDTRNLLTFNENLLASVDQTLTFLESQNADGSQTELIAQTNASKASLLSGITSLRSSIRSSEYQASSDQEPAEISDRTRELTLTQLEVEKRALDMQKDIAQLNLTLAKIGEESMFPVSPCNGTITGISVSKFASVAPGTPLATITCDQMTAKAVATVPQSLAHLLSKGDLGKSTTNGNDIDLSLIYSSLESNNGYSFIVTFDIEKDDIKNSVNGSYITVSVKTQNPFSQSRYIPIDALYQSNGDTSLHVIQEKDGEMFVEKRQVRVAKIVGSYVEVSDGLSKEDNVILDRTVTAGQKVVVR